MIEQKFANLVGRSRQVVRRIKENYWKWNKNWDVNIFIRYQPAVWFILHQPLSKNGFVLDVGSGPKGIAQFLKSQKVIGVDRFSSSDDYASNLCPVNASAYAMPFPDHSFDHVVCIDVLEHIPKKYREQTIKELIRVMRQDLVIGVPCGSGAEQKDRRSYLRDQRRGAVSRWLEEHIREGLPTEVSIEEAFSNDDTVRIIKKIRRDNIILIELRDWLSTTILNKFSRIILSPLAFASFIGWGECYRTYWFVRRTLVESHK